ANTEADLKDYRLYRSTNAGVTQVGGNVVATVLTPGTTHRDGGLGGGATYYYRLTARDVSGNESGLSVEVSTAPGAPDVTPPAVPTGLGVSDVPSDQGGALRLSWTANTESDMKDYGVYRTTWAGASPTPTRLVARIATSGTTHQDAGLATGTMHYYRLTARDPTLNESAGSAEVSSVPVDNTIPLATVTGTIVVGGVPVVVQPSLRSMVIQAQTDTKTQIVIPASMFNEAVMVGIRSRESLPTTTVAVVDAAAAKVGGRVLGTKAREFTVSKLDGSAIGGFSGLVDAYLPYDDADRDGYVDGTTIRVKDLKAYRLDETSQEWKPVADGGVNEVDETRQVVHVQLKHFSLYAVGLAASAGLGAPEEWVTVGPNPARAGEAPSVWFYADWPRWSARVRWFGPDGSLVAEIKDAESSAAGSIEREAGLKKAPAVANVHRAAWAGRNAAGTRVASGVYVVELEITNPDTGEVRRVLKKTLIVK
ncbi:MAG: hypothetical protein AAB368_02945, partial [bacterium]